MWLRTYPAALMGALSCLVSFLDEGEVVLRATEEGILLEGVAEARRAGGFGLAGACSRSMSWMASSSSGWTSAFFTESLQHYLRRSHHPVDFVLERGVELVLSGRPVVGGGILSFRKSTFSLGAAGEGFDEKWAERDVRAEVRLPLEEAGGLLEHVSGPHAVLEFDGRRGRLCPSPLNGKRPPAIVLGGQGEPVRVLLPTRELHLVVRSIPSGVEELTLGIGHTLSYEIALGKHAHGWFVARAEPWWG